MQVLASSAPSPTQNGQSAEDANSVATDSSQTGAVERARAGWLFVTLRIAAHYRIAVSPEQLRQDLTWSAKGEELNALARSAGLLIEEGAASPDAVSALRLPLVAEFDDGSLSVIETATETGYTVALADDAGLKTPVRRADLQGHLRRLFVLRPAGEVADSRIDDYIAPWRPDWLRSIVLADLKPYRAVLVASLVSNVLALAGTLFSMQVYDRVVPSQSMNTLYVLFGGVMIATLFAQFIKVLRNRITDSAGKEADLRISDRVFGHALRIKAMARPRSTGTFISQVRELESVRDMLTSTTIVAFADMPFFVLFCALYYYIAGPLIWIPLVAALLLVVPGLLAQKRLRRLAEMNTRESSLRSSMLVETIQGLDDIKALQAEGRFQNLWNHYNEATAGSSMELRDLVGRLSAWGQTIQGAVFAFVLLFGAPMVMAGEMSTGVLVAASMLSSRMIAPLGSVTQLINRWQQSRLGREALDRLMALPVDAAAEARRVNKPLIQGKFFLHGATFGYDPKAPILQVARMEIAPGERIGVLGRNGAGKSTLLAGLAGFLEPIAGEIRVDDITMGLVDPADLRRDLGYMGQNARLFHGTLRENLTMGAPMASDEQILETLSRLGSAEFVQRLPKGLDHPLQEGGLGLSGGQRQGLLLTRLLLRRSRVLLLDEPTASLDEGAEAAVIEALASLDRDTGLIVATHRPAVLRIVERLIVVNSGKIMMDGPRDEILARLRAGKATA